MVDKLDAPRIDTYSAQVVLNLIRMQIQALRLINIDATVVIIGKMEAVALNPYRQASADPERVHGLLVKIDGDVGVRVG